jgi:D-alanyl-D-alanine carboxypeptidase
MKLKLIKYSLTALLIGFSFWLYFQMSTYPYKVDRWIQPLEARVAIATAKNCSRENTWLNMLADYLAIRQGAYSAQVAFGDAENTLDTCEVGFKAVFLGESVDSTNRYRYASVSKLVTAAAIFSLVKEGKLNLDDTLVSFLPEAAQFKDERVRKITISHLLNHSAGFNRLGVSGDPMFLLRNKPWCPHDMSQLQSLKLTFNPGDRQVYSNLGYCLLGEVIHRVTGKNYHDYVNDEYSLTDRNIKFVDNYYYADEVRYDYRYEEWFSDGYLQKFDFKAVASAAGLSGSALSLAKLLRDINHHSDESPFALRTQLASCDLKKIYGCISDGAFHYQPEKNGMTLHFHGGYLPGSTSMAVVDSYGGVLVIVMSGARPNQDKPENEWMKWIYERLSLHYTMQGKLPILESFIPDNNH